MKTMILNESDVQQPEKFITAWVKTLAKELQKKKLIDKGVAEKELTLVFLNAAAAKKINWQFRGKDYPTDVLSFEGADETSLGELVLCPQVLQKQSEEHKQTYEDELGYMVLHGVLHLLGYDHEKSEEDAKKMLKLQDELFATLLKPKK